MVKRRDEMGLGYEAKRRSTSADADPCVFLLCTPVEIFVSLPCVLLCLSCLSCNRRPGRLSGQIYRVLNSMILMAVKMVNMKAKEE